jgi:hypothetical protein
MLPPSRHVFFAREGKPLAPAVHEVIAAQLSNSDGGRADGSNPGPKRSPHLTLKSTSNSMPIMPASSHLIPKGSRTAVLALRERFGGPFGACFPSTIRPHRPPDFYG